MASQRRPHMDAAELKRLREGLGLSQRQLALRLGVDGHTVRRWEDGVHRIDPLTEELLRILVEKAQREGGGGR